MITSAKNAPWPHDVPVEDYRVAGLFDPCVVRVAKIANVELRGVRRVGRIEPTLMTLVLAEIQTFLQPSNDENTARSRCGATAVTRRGDPDRRGFP